MISTLSGIGASLCACLAILIGTRPGHRLGDGWLIVWLAVFAAYLTALTFAPVTTGLSALVLGFVVQALVIALPPLQFVQVHVMTGASLVSALRWAALAGIGMLFILALPFLGTVQAEDGAILMEAAPWILLVPPLAIAATALYPIGALKRLHAHKRALKHKLARPHESDLDWVVLWVRSTLALLVVQLLVFLVSAMGVLTVPLHLAMLVVAQIAQISYVGYHGLTHTRLFRPDPGARGVDRPKDIATVEAARADFARVQQFILEEKPHTAADLTSATLAERLGWGADRLVEALRTGGETNFHDLINRSRIATFKSFAAAPENRRISLLALAHDAGFGSKSALYAAFRTFEAESPAQWRRNNTTA